MVQHGVVDDRLVDDGHGPKCRVVVEVTFGGEQRSETVEVVIMDDCGRCVHLAYSDFGFDIREQRGKFFDSNGFYEGIWDYGKDSNDGVLHTGVHFIGYLCQRGA